MSVEYFGNVKDARACVAAVLEECTRSDSYEVLPSSKPDLVSIRIAKYPRREVWVEDVVVQFEDERVCVAFHSTHGDDREAFVRFLEAVLGKLGRAVAFVED